MDDIELKFRDDSEISLRQTLTHKRHNIIPRNVPNIFKNRLFHADFNKNYMLPTRKTIIKQYCWFDETISSLLKKMLYRNFKIKSKVFLLESDIHVCVTLYIIPWKRNLCQYLIYFSHWCFLLDYYSVCLYVGLLLKWHRDFNINHNTMKLFLDMWTRKKVIYKRQRIL